MLLTDLPAMQRERALTVFSEGWGLYAEQLAEEMGLYSGTQSLLGAVAGVAPASGTPRRRHRAACLWVEPGRSPGVLHRPRPPATRVPRRRRSTAISSCRAKRSPTSTGKREILRLREEARRRLGSAFSLPEFHSALLDQGSLPMPVLESAIAEWLAGR